MWYKTLNHHWTKTKNFIHQGYGKLKGFMGDLDRGAGIMRKMFQLATPALQDIGADHVVKKGNELKDQYDSIKGNVSSIDKRVRQHASAFDEANIFE